MRAPRPCRWLSRLPPCCPAQPFATSSPSVATPTTPTIGRAWNEMRSFMRTVSPSTSKTNVTGESTSAISWPNSGMIVAKPRGPGRTSSSSTMSESPGSAPFTATGPVALFTRVKSIAVTRSSSEAICPVKQSFVSNVTTAPGSTSSTCSRFGPKPQITSSRETRCSVATAIGAAILLPGRRVMNPPTAAHRCDDLAAVEIVVRIRRQNDEVCEKTRQQLAAAPFVVRQPRWSHACGLERLLERHRFLRPPLEAAADACQRIELFDRRIGAVGDNRAALPERAKAIGAIGAVAPETLDQRTVRRRVDELHRRDDAELREARDVLRRQALRVFDPMAQAERPPHILRRLERVERVAVCLVADRVHRHRKVRRGANLDQLLELFARRDAHARAVQQERGLRAERPVHERLQRAEPEERTAEPAAQAELGDLARVLMRDPLPHAKRQRAVCIELLEERRPADPTVLVRDRGVDRGDATRSGELQPFANRRERLALAVRRLDELLPEEPCRLLAQDARRLALLVDLDHASLGAEVAVGVRERR